MTIATLEKIHELLKKEVKTRNNELELTRKVYNERQDDLKAIAAATDDICWACSWTGSCCWAGGCWPL